MKALYRILPAIIVLAAMTAGTTAFADTQFFATIIGSHQGQFKGSSTEKQHLGQIPLIAFNYALASNAGRLLGSGAGAGRVQQEPLAITKQVDAASPQIFQAIVAGELLSKVEIDYYRDNSNGEQMLFYKVLLHNAFFTSLKQGSGSVPGANGASSAQAIEQLSLNYQKIEIQDMTDQAITAVPAGL